MKINLDTIKKILKCLWELFILSINSVIIHFLQMRPFYHQLYFQYFMQEIKANYITSGSHPIHFHEKN